MHPSPPGLEPTFRGHGFGLWRGSLWVIHLAPTRQQWSVLLFKSHNHSLGTLKYAEQSTRAEAAGPTALSSLSDLTQHLR